MYEGSMTPNLVRSVHGGIMKAWWLFLIALATTQVSAEEGTGTLIVRVRTTMVPPDSLTYLYDLEPGEYTDGVTPFTIDHSLAERIDGSLHSPQTIGVIPERGGATTIEPHVETPADSTFTLRLDVPAGTTIRYWWYLRNDELVSSGGLVTEEAGLPEIPHPARWDTSRVSNLGGAPDTTLSARLVFDAQHWGGSSLANLIYLYNCAQRVFVPLP